MMGLKWFAVLFLAIAPASSEFKMGRVFGDFEGNGKPIEGQILDYKQLGRLEGYVPAPIWENRKYIFTHDTSILVGPAHRDYSPAPEFQKATETFSKRVSMTGDGYLLGYVAGLPFEPSQISCQTDPHAGQKWIWNFQHQWDGDGGHGRFRLTTYNNGKSVPMSYSGETHIFSLSGRVEPQYKENGRSIFENENRRLSAVFLIEQPFDFRGLEYLTYRYRPDPDSASQRRRDDVWAFIPTLQKTRRMSAEYGLRSFMGVQYGADELRGFSGYVEDFDWKCLRVEEVFTPMNSRMLGYPYNKNLDPGPYGVSYSRDRWEFRRAVVLRMTPRDSHHSNAYRDIYIDQQTQVPLYSFAYDRDGSVMKIFVYNNRWSEDHPDWYRGWKGVPKPRDLKVVSEAVINVKTRDSNRIDAWDLNGMPLKNKGKILRYSEEGYLGRAR